MGDFSALYFKRLQELAKEHNLPDVVKKEIDAGLQSCTARTAYCNTVSSPPSEDVKNIMVETVNHPWKKLHEDGTLSWVVSAHMQSGQLGGKFLKSLVSMCKAKRVLEVGLFTGTGALSMAEALPADGVVVTCELEKYFQELSRKNVDRSPHGKKIIIKPGPAKDTLEAMAKAGEQFDFVFIDADKGGYKTYYNIIMDNNMVTPGGVIAVDNVLFGGFPYTDEDEYCRITGQPKERVAYRRPIAEFNDYVAKDNRVNIVLAPVGDGVLIVQRKEDYEGKA